MRSNKASNDYSTTTDALEEVLNEYIKIGKSFTYCCCIYPTAPFITPQKLQAAYKKISTSTAHSVIPIVKFGFPILRSLKIEEGLLKMNWPEYMNVRSQDLQPAFHDAGQFYFFSVKEFLTNKKIFTENTIGIEMPESEVQDIDTLEDWKIAELKYAIMKSLL